MSLDKKYDQTLILLLLALSVTQALKISGIFSYQYLDWCLGYGIVIFTFVKMFYDGYLFSVQNIPFYAYAIWLIICVFRGMFTAETYWETKFLTTNSMCLCLPIFAVLFRKPDTTLSFFICWNKLIPVYLLLFIVDIIPVYWTHFLMGPAFLLLGAFWFTIPNYKWKLIILGILVIMLIRLDARSQVIKAVIAVVMSFAMLCDKWIPRKLVQIGALSFYFLAILLLWLGVTGRYNIFDQSDKAAPDVYINGELQEKADVTADTRTFIYVEVLTSAVNNDYIWTGRTPARGNDSETVGKQAGEIYGADAKPERNANEICHTNVFTWLGLIGVILYSLLYLQATIEGAFFSKNSYVRYIAALVGFHWMLGWVEDMNTFIYLNVGIWMLIGMCMSPEFRGMTNLEFKLWFKSLFSWNWFTPYYRYNMLKACLAYKLNKKKES